jgi:hypothetical protein
MFDTAMDQYDMRLGPEVIGRVVVIQRQGMIQFGEVPLNQSVYHSFVGSYCLSHILVPLLLGNAYTSVFQFQELNILVIHGWFSFDR